MGGRNRSWVALATLCVLVSACGNSSSGPTSPNRTPILGGTLIVAAGNDPGKVNPDLTTSSPDSIIGQLVYEGLVLPRMDGKADPLLAKSWAVSPDGLVYTFQLVTAQWSDGQQFTSADVKFTLEKVSSKYSAIFSKVPLQGVDASDPHVAIVRLKQPFGPMLLALYAQSGAAILPAHIYDGTNFLTNPANLAKPVGTGPFLLTEFTPGDHVTLTKNPHYWQAGKPRLDKIIWRTIPSGPSRVLALHSGEIHYITVDFLTTSDWQGIQNDPKLQLKEFQYFPSNDLLFFNVRRGPTADPVVRRALAMATDQTFLTKAIYSGTGQPGISSIDTRINWAYNPSVDYRKMFAFDPAKAKSLLDQAGYKAGPDGTRFNFNMVVSASQQNYVSEAEAIKSMWAPIGVNVKVEAVDQNALIKRIYTDAQFDGHLSGYTTFGDPALGISRQYVTSSIGVSFGNASGYSNPQIDQLFADGQRGTTPTERAKAYAQAQTIIAQDLPLLVVHQKQFETGASKRVQGAWEGGMQTGHLGYGDFVDTWLLPA